jgi:hypothetical protein
MPGRDLAAPTASLPLLATNWVLPRSWSFAAPAVAAAQHPRTGRVERSRVSSHSLERKFIKWCTAGTFTWLEQLDLPPNDLEGSDDSLRLQPGVGDWLTRQALLVGPLVQVKCVLSRTGSAISAQPCMAGGRVIVSCG